MHQSETALIFGLPYDPWIVTMSFVVTGLIVVFSFFASRRITQIPRGWQNIMEILIEFIENAIRGSLGERGIKYTYFFGSLFVFILIANTLGLIPGLASPTRDVSVTLCLAFLTLIWMHYISLRENGIKLYLKHFMDPNPLFLPLHLIEMVTRPLTLALRLFGNIFAGEVLLEVLTKICFPIPMPAIWLLFSLAIGGIQAYIFTLISIAYTGLTLGEPDSHH
jgi:F-type H+-transporting ATPase subunit a